MLLVIIAAGLLGTLIGWYTMSRRGLHSPALMAVWIAGALVLSLLFIATWRRLLPQRVIEMCCLLYAVSICVACMALRMYSPRYGAEIDLEPLYLWIPVVYVFAFTLTNHKTGLRISLGIMLLFVAISLPYLVRDIEGPFANFTVQLHVVSAAMIATLYFFSGYQHRLRLAQATLDRLARLSNTDDLTGLSNRRHMAVVVRAELARFTKGGDGFAVMLFDVDRFKEVNDRFGHGAGDEVLAALAARAGEVVRGMGTLGRWGGDEFVALVRGMDAEDAVRMADALCAYVASTPLSGDRLVTISCGVTVARNRDSVDSLLQRADAALYAAKRGGRNRVEVIHEGA